MLYWRQSFTVSAFALPCSAHIYLSYPIMVHSWFIHVQRYRRSAWANKSHKWPGTSLARFAGVWGISVWPWARSGLLLCDTAPKATSVAMACKPSPGEFITSSTQKVEIYWRMALSHCLKLNLGLLKISEHQWCDVTNPLICYTVEYTLVTLVLEFGSLAPMFEPFSKGYPCTRKFFQRNKCALFHKCFVTSIWSKVLGLPFTRQDWYSKFVFCILVAAMQPRLVFQWRQVSNSLSWLYAVPEQQLS